MSVLRAPGAPPVFGDRLRTAEEARYGPTSIVTERALFSGYRSTSGADVESRIRSLRCACGGVVRAVDMPADGVALHSTGRHRAWRAAEVELGRLVDMEELL